MLHNSLIKLDPKTIGFEANLYYATSNNLTGYAFYNRTDVILHKVTAQCLIKAIELAQEIGYTFVIWDAFRPLEGQQALWNALPDPNYISQPGVGPQTHCRGTAIDLTLKDNESGQLLNMGTDFDEMSEHSHHANRTISPDAQKNRFILAGIMHVAGFEKFDSEWWHYQLPNYRKYPAFNDQEAGSHMIHLK